MGFGVARLQGDGPAKSHARFVEPQKRAQDIAHDKIGLCRVGALCRDRAADIQGFLRPAEPVQNFGGIGMRLDEKGVDPASLEIGHRSGFEFADIFEDVAEIAMRRGEAGIEAHGALSGFPRRLKLARFAQNGGEIGVGAGIIGLKADGFADIFRRLAWRPVICSTRPRLCQATS